MAAVLSPAARRRAPASSCSATPARPPSSRVVQLAGDAGPLREHGLEPGLGALRGEAGAAALPRDRGEGRGRHQCKDHERKEPPASGSTPARW